MRSSLSPMRAPVDVAIVPRLTSTRTIFPPSIMTMTPGGKPLVLEYVHAVLSGDGATEKAGTTAFASAAVIPTRRLPIPFSVTVEPAGGGVTTGGSGCGVTPPGAGEVVGGFVVMTDELSVVVVVIEVVSAGLLSVFAHAASARAQENTTEGRMKCMQVPRLTVLFALTTEVLLVAWRWGPLQAPYERDRYRAPCSYVVGLTLGAGVGLVDFRSFESWYSATIVAIPTKPGVGVPPCCMVSQVPTTISTSITL
jgi:hypothetical protein